MKLYYTKGACSLAARIIINELGVNCEYESVDLTAKRTESGQDYFKINPKGAVPALQIGDQVLTENAVIHQYLADENNAIQLLPPIGDFKRYRVLEWENYLATELHKSYGPLFNPTIPQEIKEKYLIPILKTKLNYVDQQLQGKDYLCEDHFTMPDAYLFVMIAWTRYFKFDLNTWPNLSRYFTALQKRPSIQQSLKEEELSVTT